MFEGKFVREVEASALGKKLDGVSDEAKRQTMIDVQKKLESYDEDLITRLQKETANWDDVVKTAKKKRQPIALNNPYLSKLKLPSTFSVSDRFAARDF